MSKNCIITTVKSKIKGNATSYIERESEIFIPISKKFTLKQTRAMAQDKVNIINKEYLSEKFGEVVSLNTSYTDGTGINIHPSQRLVDAYEVKEGNKTIQEVNTLSNRNIEYFNGEDALLVQDEDDRELKVQKELDKIVEKTNNIEEKSDTYFNITPEVDFNLRATQILSSQKADEIFRKGDKNNWSLEKILQELQVPKEQQELIKSLNTRNREEILTNLLANYSYTVEINTAKGENKDLVIKESEFLGEKRWRIVDSVTLMPLKSFKSEKEANDYLTNELQNPTQHYSNLTVPGGTAYTENEIATPAITPSIKGHAQFATENGIGWFRSDDRLAEDTKTDNIDGTITDYTGYNVNKIPSGYTIYNKNRGWLRDATGKPLDFKTEKEASDYLNKLINQGITNNSSIITKNDKIIFGHPTIGKSYLKQKGNNDFITLDDDYADEVNAFIDANRGSETRQEYKGRKPKEYNEFMLNLFDRLKLQAKKEGKRLFVSNTNILKERMSEFDKVITIPKDEFKKRFDARGATYGFEDWKSDIDATVAKVDKSKVISTTGYLSDLLEGNPKTRRILEVQSDLFQKGRDKDILTGKIPDWEIKKDNNELPFYILEKGSNEIIERFKTKEEAEDTIHGGFKERFSKENQFLQLLNKDNNWVTFFIKSIIQDSAKKGYEKVLFPTGNTASKVEGHTTLEEFKKQNEDRIKVLGAGLKLVPDPNIDFTKYSFRELKDMGYDYLGNENGKAIWKPLIKDKTEALNEINQLKQELERVETEGFGALKPIYNFYENTVTNILKKNYQINKVTDEYGNTWNEVEIKSEFKNQISLNLSQKSAELKALPNNQWFNKTIQPIINRFSKMFPNVRSVVISEKKIPNEVKSIVDGLDKQINSFFHKGQVYIIKERVTKDIAIEEFLHPFINALEQDNPELFKSLLLEAKKLFPELKEEVFTKYEKVYNSIFDLNREFLTQALTQKVSEQTPEQETFFQKFKTWIRNILDRLFGNEATTREISMLDETMSLTDLASILNENNTQFNFNSDTNTTYYSLNEEEITNYLNRPKTQIQAQILDKILENNKVTQTDFTGGRHEYTRNELGEILQLKPVSNFLSKKINPELDFSDFAQIGNAIHEIVKNINLNLLPRTQLIDTYAEKSDLKRILVEEKGYPIEAVKQILSNIYDYVTPLIGSKESLIVSEVSISALQDLGEYKGVAGTIDLLEITKDGNLVIHDFKSMYLNGLETYVYTNNPSTQLDKKFNVDNITTYREQLSLYAKMLKGIVGNKNITLQIVPIGYLATSETKDKTIQVNFSDKLVKTDASLNVENYIYSPFNLMNVSKQQAKFQVTYFKSFVDKILPSIKDEEITKKLTKEEIDRQELLDNLTDKIKSENSKSFEAEIEKVFKQVTTIVTQYGNSQNELNKELFKLFDPKGDLKETKANFEAIFETIKEMGEDNPEKLKHYLSTLVQYINYIEETNVGLSNIKSHFYKIVANDANLDNQTLISDMRRSYLLAKSHKERINSILVQLGDIKEDNVFKQMLRKSTSYVDEIENLYFEKSLPLIANVLNSYFGKEFRDNMSKEIQDRLNKEKYDLNLATSDNAKIRINNKIIKLEEQLKMIPNPNLIADIIQGKYGDSDWFYSNLMANINNPDYVISGTESFMTDIMRDLSLIAIKQEEEFARQFSKREDTLKVNRDQVKEMNKDLVYTSNHLVKKADGTTEVLKSMTLLTEVNEDVYFDYEVLQDQLLKTEPNTPERKVIADKIKQFENEHFESEFNPKYLKALSAIDVVVSDGRNVKQVRQAILDKIKAIKVSNYKLNYLQGELESEDDLVELRELWREFMNLSSTIDRNGNKKTGANLEIADILQARKKELEEFRDKKVDEDLWKKLKAKKIQSLLGKYNTEEEVLKSEEYKKWQSFNSVISPTEEFYELRQSKLNSINLILDKKQYKDIPLVGQLKDNLNQSWEKLLAISREYRDFEREIISGDIPEGTKQSMKVLEENINKIKNQIKGLEKSLSKQDKKDLNTLWEEYNSMIEYKNSKYYEEDFESALNQYALENGLEVSELRNDSALMTQFRLNNEWYINSHITKERYDKLTAETIKYSEPVYYYKVVIPTDSNYIKESPASQYTSFELKPEAYNLDEEGKPNYLDVFGRKKVKKSSKYITENIPYLKIKNDLSPKGRVNFENLEFLKKEMEEAQKGLNKQNYLYYQIPANRKSTFERVSEGDLKGVKENIKAKFSINPQDEAELGTRGVLANLSGEEAKFIPVLGKSKIDFNDQSYNIWKSILDYTLSAQKAKMFEEKLPVLDVLVDQLEKNLPAVDGNKNEAIGESMSKKFNLENVKEVIKGRGDKRVQAVKDTVARYVYEEFTKELANIGGISDIKLTNTLLGYSGATMMVGNIPNWIVNAMSGNIQLMIEAAGKRYFTSKDVKNAKIELMSRHKDAIADYTKTHDKSLFGQMIEYFDPVKGEFMDNLGNRFDWSKRTNIKQIFFSGKIYGEWEMQMTTFIAMLKAKKVTQIINGVEKTIDLYDAFEKGEDGIPKLKEGVQITDRELREYMTRIQGVNKLLNGSYAKLDQTKIEKYSLGRMAIFMKKFFIPLFVNRFGEFRGDSELQDVREGHYISFYNAIVKDMFNLPIGEIYAKMKKSPEDGGYTDLQKSAITKTIRELAFIAALWISLVLLGYDDDEDDSDAKKFAQYIALKLRREVATFTPVAAPQEFASFFSRPFAAMSSTGNLINLGGMVLKTPINVATGAFEDDLYYQRKTSMWDAGDSKFLALLYKSMGLKLNIAHPDQLLQGYNYSIRL